MTVDDWFIHRKDCDCLDCEIWFEAAVPNVCAKCNKPIDDHKFTDDAHVLKPDWMYRLCPSM